MIYRIRNWLMATLVLLCAQAGAASLSDLQVSNGDQQARITLSFIGDPEYAVSQDGKRTVALDIKQTGVIQGLPLLFSGNNLVKSIRSGTPKDAQSLRLVVDLTENGKAEAVKRQNGGNYTVVFTIKADAPPPPPPPPVVAKRVEAPVIAPRPAEPARNPFKAENDRTTMVTNSNTSTRPAARASTSNGEKVVIAIDAGHGGQDPGAIGPGGTREKNVTIAVARKLRSLLNDDPMFKGVLTRDGDYFISVMGRSDVARKQNANFWSLFMRMPHQTGMPLVLPSGYCQTVGQTVRWPAGWNSTKSNRNCWVGRAMCWQTASPILISARPCWICSSVIRNALGMM